jgi:hypothetical protein
LGSRRTSWKSLGPPTVSIVRATAPVNDSSCAGPPMSARAKWLFGSGSNRNDGFLFSVHHTGTPLVSNTTW